MHIKLIISLFFIFLLQSCYSDSNPAQAVLSAGINPIFSPSVVNVPSDVEIVSVENGSVEIAKKGSNNLRKAEKDIVLVDKDLLFFDVGAKLVIKSVQTGEIINITATKKNTSFIISVVK